MTNTPKFSLEALTVLEAVARHSSFAKAASELHKVPSAISYSVAQLEASLGFQLFDRTGRVIKLTPMGADFLIEARRLLRSVTDMEQRLAQLCAGWEAELRIAVDTVFGVQSLYSLLPAFDALCSGTRLQLREEAFGGCWDALEADRADIVIAGLGAGGVPPGGGYSVCPLGAIAFDYVVAPVHPLAALAEQVGRPLTDAEVRLHRAVSVADSSRYRPPRTIGILSGQNTLTVSTMDDKLAAQLQGFGAGFMPRHLAQPEMKRGGLVRLDVEQPRPEAVFCLAWRRDTLGKSGHWWVEQFETRTEAASAFFALFDRPA
ncbi:MAG: LysR family transcriptional regulator [Burkholderiales bacterium]|jgi:DNA-binding transcriptional LysR family regulator|nr:LysR family transcriptional regulator [Nitrosomonadaceae bacterium]